MANNYARPLTDHETIDGFLVNCLGVAGSLALHNGKKIKTAKAAQRIRDAEGAISKINPANSTLSSAANRIPAFKDQSVRMELRQRIVSELTQMERLDSDDKIKLGRGGAKPKGRDPAVEKRAYIIIGLPASGKSTLVSKISDQLGAIVLDSDFAKRKLPEFDDTIAGAQLVHQESSDIIFGEKYSLFNACVFRGYNVVIPTIGANESDLLSRRDSLIKAGYEVHLTLTYLTREAATTRALDRYLTTGRYVPLCLIFDSYANDPILNYYKARMNGADPGKGWASFGVLSTESSPAKIIDVMGSNPVELMR